MPLLGYKSFPGIKKIINVALSDIKKLEKAGFDGALVDNHAHPHVVKATGEMVASFSAVMVELIKKSKIPLGVQFLIDDPEASLAIAKSSGASFIRTDFFVDKVKTEYGVIFPRAKEIVNYKKAIFAKDVLIFADVQIKHAKMLQKKSISKSVKQAFLAGANAVIVTGAWTGIAPELNKVKKAKKAAGTKIVLIGSGLNPQNAKELLNECDGALVGTSVRKGSRIDAKKANILIKSIKKGGGVYGD